MTQSTPSLDVALLQSSFAKVEPQSAEFSATFYRILLDKYPQLHPLFADTDMAKQQSKLMESLRLVVANVENADEIVSSLKNLGKRHVKYGAALTDYPLVGDALLQSLEQHLGADWTPDVQANWIEAYQTIAGIMTTGAGEVETE
jgi:nitric oxide dioxygenase